MQLVCEAAMAQHSRGVQGMPPKEIFNIVKAQRCNLVNCIKEINIILTPRVFYTALMQSITKLMFFEAVKA